MTIIPDPPVEAYAPYHRPGDVLMQWQTLRSEPVFQQPGMAHLLRSVLRDVQSRCGFRLHGWAILQDQVHLLLNPSEDGTADRIARQTRHRFQLAYPEVRGLPQPTAIWDQKRLLEPLSTVEDFACALDALHYAPVAQKLCQRPEEWSQSSYGSWIERGLYKLGWGWARPERLRQSDRKRTTSRRT